MGSKEGNHFRIKKEMKKRTSIIAFRVLCDRLARELFYDYRYDTFCISLANCIIIYPTYTYKYILARAGVC